MSVMSRVLVRRDGSRAALPPKPRRLRQFAVQSMGHGHLAGKPNRPHAIA